MRRRLSSILFRTARQVDTAEAIASGNPERMVRRGRNILLGRLLARAGFWRKLWR